MTPRQAFALMEIAEARDAAAAERTLYATHVAAQGETKAVKDFARSLRRGGGGE